MAAPVIKPADRLSNLPEEIQAQILSFLPAQEAVRTCVLARTWRHRWKLTRRLLITGGDADEAVSSSSVQEVRGFVDRLLRLRLDGLDDHAPVEACMIMYHWCGSFHRFGDDSGDDGDEEEIAHAVRSWIDRVLECHVQSLRVDMHIDFSYYEPYLEMCDKMSLVSQHLTRLELRGLRFSGDESGYLNFSGCSALEHLEVTFCDLSCLEKVISPSVKRLVIKECASCQYDRLRICFPLLVWLFLEYCFDNTPVLESMPQLAVAYVSTDEPYSTFYDNGCRQDVTECLVLTGLAQARHLVLLSSKKTLVFRWDLKWCPIFSNLKTLVLNDYWCESAEYNELACMLEHAPVLEKLTILFSGTKFFSQYDVVVEGSPDETAKSIMISQHLKIVEVKCLEVDQRVLKVLEFLGFPFLTEGNK